MIYKQYGNFVEQRKIFIENKLYHLIYQNCNEIS